MADRVRVNFVCWGNICRSPMAERMFERAVADAGLADEVEVSSSGVSSEETGNPIDDRAVDVLTREGLRTADHAAHRITADEAAGADLVVCMEDEHRDRVLRLLGDDPDAAEKVVLLTDFDPEAAPGDPVPDPWFGGGEGFDATRATLQRAMPGLLDRVRELTGRA